MLLNNFCTLLNHETSGDTVKATVSFYAAHQIFKGHFPGHPVVPGVCMMQIVRELMEVSLSKKLQIVTGDNMKFLSVINPEENKEVEINISFTSQEDTYLTNAVIQAGSVTFFKFKGMLKSI